MKKIIVLLDNIRSSENVGSAFRTSEAVGVSEIILCGITPAPLDRFGRENKKIAKSALGAEKLIKWKKVENFKDECLELKKNKFKIVGVEQSQNSINYKDIYNFIPKDEDIAFVFGNEVEGISKEDLGLCDVVLEIPMIGKKESLNVAVAIGIILFNSFSSL